MSLLIAAALIAAPALHLSPREELRSRIQACGLARDRITVKYVPLFEDDVVQIGKGAALSRKTFDCLVGLPGVNTQLIRFESSGVQKAYDRINAAYWEAKYHRMAVRWLQGHGKLSALPRFDPASDTVASFAKRLEVYCGLKPGSMLVEYRPGRLTLRPDVDFEYLRAEDRFTCVTDAIEASNLDQHGVRFGFVGNEAPARP